MSQVRRILKRAFSKAIFWQLGMKIMYQQKYFDFDNFYTSDRSESAEAKKLAESFASNGDDPSKFIMFSGKTGLGKTHLLKAIQENMKREKPNIEVDYFTAENLCRFVKSDEVINKSFVLPSTDVILLDCVEDLIDLEFGRNRLIGYLQCAAKNDKRIALASAYLDSSFKDLVDTLSHQFDISYAKLSVPEESERLEILLNLEKTSGIEVHRDVLSLLVSQFSNPRELEGAFLQLASIAQFNNKEVDIALTKSLIK